MSQHSILHTLAPQLRQQFAEQTQVMTFPSGQVLFNPGERCQGLPLVLSGVVKVQMTGFGYRAEANVEDEVEVIMVPRPLFDRLMDQSDGFRQGIMESYGCRLDDLMLLVEEVAFRRMDERLNEWLQARAERSPLLITHQDLAIELGTAREVVSRLLKELERKNQVRLARGRIDIL
ncbi:MAG: CRP/FNR family transcriptional regulator [Marinobacter psychrophilus]|jgi:CRP/FNR family transcriptional regulator|uniref:Crp/Fnr family transcriptional regulator n=1 Tax=Marinobacter psychrophilus TaxID=330734 RepID=UPI0039E45DAF